MLNVTKLLKYSIFGFKLHIIINDRGEIISFVITQGNIDDREPLSTK